MNKKHFLLGVNVFGNNKRQELALNSYQKLKGTNSNLDLSIVQNIKDNTTLEKFKRLNVYRDSSHVCETNKQIPLVNDIFNALAEECEEYFIFCNSDIILSQSFFNYLNTLDTIEAFGVSRIDIPNITKLSDPFVPYRMEPAGFDCWVVNKEWWFKNNFRFKDFILGRPFFDVHYSMLMFKYSKDFFINTESLIYHILHKREWVDKDECYLFNENQRDLFFKEEEIIWSKISNNTYLIRKDWNIFLNIGENEKQFLQKLKNEIA